LFLAGDRAGVVYLWDLKTCTVQSKYIGHEALIAKVSFSPDQSAVLSLGKDGTARLWHTATGAELLRFGSLREPVVSAALNPEGSVLLLGGCRDNGYGLKIYRLGQNSATLLRSMKSFSQ
jgi:WD40 repeat protein